MPYSRSFVDMGYKRSFASIFHLGNKLKENEHYFIEFLCLGYRVPLEHDFFDFGTKFAVSHALEESLKRML
ncbi:hypothetical protein [Roseimicrobium gellanilyticum]|nr:hypothetical protein [Roseimicrobium gellanilyticum]